MTAPRVVVGVRATCAMCGRWYVARNPCRRWCSENCRVTNHRGIGGGRKYAQMRAASAYRDSLCAAAAALLTKMQAAGIPTEDVARDLARAEWEAMG